MMDDGRRREVQRDHVIEIENVIGNEVQGGGQLQAQGDHDSTNHRPTGTNVENCELEICRATMEGDWKAAEKIYTDHNLDFNAPVAGGGLTILHVAALSGQAAFVTELVRRMSDEGISRRDGDGNAGIVYAAMSRDKETAEAIIGRKRDMVVVRNDGGMLPLCFAGIFGLKDMVSYLYGASMDQLEDKDRADLFSYLINNDIHDIALDILEQGWERLATTKASDGETILHEVARNPRFLANSTSARELVGRICERVASLTTSEIENLLGGDWGPLFLAAEQGNVEFIRILIRTFPSILRMNNPDCQTIFHIAVSSRHEEIFKLIHEIGTLKHTIAWRTNPQGNHMLHLAGMLAPLSKLNVVPGAALQLQRELLWFEEVKKVVGPRLAKLKNHSGQTPDEIFMESHGDLIKKGEEWMRNTANSCLIVAALVATVVFASAFTVPAGNDQNTGFPMFLNKTVFRIFMVFDAISLISSVTSVLTFLSVLTSTYQLEDFVQSLPKKLVIGFATLFVSIAAMMVAFVIVFFVYFRHNSLLVYAIVVAVAAFVPICIFVMFEFRLFVSVIKSTYKSPFRPNYKDPLLQAPKKNKKA